MTPALKSNANFRWLMAGGVLSLIGGQFTLIALPWLVLKLSGDPLSLGLVLALMGIPRAVFILIGGAVVDRYSPKRVMMLSKRANAVLLGVLAMLVLSGSVTLPAVYALALLIGLAEAFGIPAGTSIMPLSIPRDLLPAANSAMMAVRRLTMLAGPLLAALLLAVSDDYRSLGMAFAFDCLGFIFSAWTLSHVQPLAPPQPAKAAGHVLRSVAEGLQAVWRDVEMRLCFMYWGLVSLLIGGTMQVALPVLAKARLHDASAFGLLMAANGTGMMLGMAASAAGTRKLSALGLGTTMLAVDALAGLILLPLGAIETTWQGMALLLLLGVISGLMQVAVFTWLQSRVQPEMMGRTMSVFLFILLGLAPLSAAAAGWLLQYVSLAEMFAGGGAVLIVCAAGAWLFTPIRSIGAQRPQHR